MANQKYKLTYFNVQYLAEPTRYLFAFAGIDYEDVRVERGDWPELKHSMPWKTLPVLADGDRVIGQSLAILRYLARKHGFYGETPLENAACDEIVDATNDWRLAMHTFYMCKNQEEKEKMQETIVKETMPKALTILSDMLTNNGKFLVGNNFTFADFYVAHMLQMIEKVAAKNMFEDFPIVENHQKTVFGAPGIKEWIAKRPETQF